MKFFNRGAFWRHPPSFFSSDFGHVTPPLSCACHVNLRSCCRRSCACLCHGCGWAGGYGLLLGRLSGTTCYGGQQSWYSGSLPCAYYTPYDGQPRMSVFDVLRVSVWGLVPVRRCNWLHSRGMSVGITTPQLSWGWSLSLGATRMLLIVVWGLAWAATPVFLIIREMRSVTPPM